MPFRVLILLLFCVGALPASARDLTEAERQSLPEAVGSLEAALAAQDVVTVMSLTPPLVVAGLAERMGMTVPDMVQAMADQTAAAAVPATVHSVTFDVDVAETRQAGGEPYLLIPTEIVITFPGVGSVRERAHTLAFSEAGEWRLMRLGDAGQRALLRTTYPRFADTELPEGTVEKVGP